MKRRKTRILALLLFVEVLFLQLPVLALEAFSDQKEKSTLTIEYAYDGHVIPNARFDLYYVASRVSHEEFAPTAQFSGYASVISKIRQSDWSNMAVTLKGYILRDGVLPMVSGITDRNGMLTFRELESGLYLIVGHQTQIDSGTYICDPFLLTLPTEEIGGNGWNYDAVVKPKSQKPSDGLTKLKILKIWDDMGMEGERPTEVSVSILCDGVVYETVRLNAGNNWRYEWRNLENEHDWSVYENEVPFYSMEISREGNTFEVKNIREQGGAEEVPSMPPDSPEPPTSSEELLPQTGLLWWPVPVLAACGLVMLVIGCRRRRLENQKDE